jgi:hypothetical protein
VVRAGWPWRVTGGHVVVTPPRGTPVVLGISGFDNDRDALRRTFRRLGLPGVDGELPRAPQGERSPSSSAVELEREPPAPGPGASYIETVWPIPAPEPEPEACATCAHPVRRWHGVAYRARCSSCVACIELDAARHRGGLHV